jgi:LPS export ABC transporter permease LptG/LPS export ABC transporter permease LptF
MRILSRYVFREIVTSFFLATGLSTFVIFLQSTGRLFELLVRSANAAVFLELCVLVLPPVLLLSIPFGVLVGILVGLGRMSSDNEMVALRSGGISSKIVAPPVLLFATLAMGVSAACALWLNPIAVRAEYKLLNKAAPDQVTADVTPRVFEERFTNDTTVLYVDDVGSGMGPTEWHGVFIADLTPGAERRTGLKEQSVGPKITLAREAIAVPDPKNNRIQLTLRDESVHEPPYHSMAPRGTMTLQQTQQQEQKAKPYVEMFTRDLLKVIAANPRASQDGTDSRIELHRRLALPVACLMLAMVGIPLGASSRKGGRSAGYIWAILLAFFVYYLSYISLTSLARAHTISVELASWLPNAVFGIAGIIMIARMDRPGDRDVVGMVRDWMVRVSGSLERSAARGDVGGFRILVFQILDSYVLSSFLLYFVLWLAALVAMTQIFNFFDLLGDIVKNHIPMSRVLTYHLFLTPKLVYDTMPICVLLAVLVTFGVMTKNNEVTAFKACGISVRRLGFPVLLMSGLLSAALFGSDYAWIPRSNQIQDAIRNEIKGRYVQTYLHPERKWIIHDYKVFYYKYFDPSEKVMVEPWVFEIDPKTFHLSRQINANRARWQQNIGQWVWEQGTIRDICGVDECKIQNFTVTAIPEISEKPEDFLKEVRQNQQMNYQELASYVDDLQRSGFDTVKLRVQYYKKFAVPTFALIMALISVPFAFAVGTRGAMAGIGFSIGVAISYLGVAQLFEQVGNVSYLPPAIAAWSPDVLFALAGMYLTLRMRS